MRRHEFARFASALTNAQPSLPAGFIAPSGAVLADRFAVYRNNMFASLIEALAQRFAATCAVVGEEFFKAMARTYVETTRPAREELQEYGDSFADFVAAFPSVTSLPWLPDLARLETLWSQSWAAADAPALSLKDLQGMAPDALLATQFIPHPAARLLRSTAPVASLWQAHQDAAPDLSMVQWRAQDVLVTRPQAQVLITQLSPGVATFARALMHGATIEVAADSAIEEYRDFAIGPALAGLLNSGFATGLISPCN